MSSINNISIYQGSNKARYQRKGNYSKLGNVLREESPQYRIGKMGADNLKTTELLALIIGEGSNKETAIKIAEELLCKFEGNLSRFARATAKELFGNGIGQAKISRLLAAIELGKRIAGYSEVEKPSIHTPSDVARLLMSEMRYYKKEVFKVLLLDTKNRLIKIETISSGILDASLVHPREVFYAAIQEMASSVILVHNHPSGNIIPSAQDIEITKTIIEAGKIMNIDVIDHIIIGEGKFLSLKEKKII